MRLNNWLSRLTNTTSRRRTTRRNHVTQSLEQRTLLTVVTEFNATIGELEVESNADDDIVISATADGSDVLVNGTSTGVAPADVVKLEVKGGPLDNLLDVSAVTDEVFTSLVEVELKGNEGNDTLIGSEFDDELKGGTGNDVLEGGQGDDDLRGGHGRDTMSGDAGDDSIHGGKGSDSLSGSDGEDTVVGHNGSDTITGGAGADSIVGNRGPDIVNGDEGDDTIKGGSSDDLLKGGPDDDSLDGGRGDDLLDGDEGNDQERRGFSTDLESTFYAQIDGVNGDAKFERDVEGDIELEFELEVEDITPGSYAVTIDGQSIGTLEINEFGNGRIEYSTDPDDPGELQMPADFPEIADGSVIEIEGLGSGTFQQFEDFEIETIMTPMNGSNAFGEIEYEVDGLEREFELEAEDLEPGTYDLIIDGVVIDTFTVSGDELEIEYESENGFSNFPLNFPELGVGSVIELEGVLTITL